MPTNVRCSVEQSPAAPASQRRRLLVASNTSRPRGAGSLAVTVSRAFLAGATVLMAALVLLPAVGVADDGHDVLEFHVMTPVTGPYVGSANPIRGVNGGGLPWVISRGRGHLEGSGDLEIRVRGLVLADDPSVPANLRLTNPVPNFKAIVSCQSIDAGGQAVTVNASTDEFPATTSGDAHFEGTVVLPSPCIAPIVFVTSPGGAWFAATGQ